MTDVSPAGNSPPSSETLLKSFKAVVGRSIAPITLRQFAMLVLLEQTKGPLGVDDIALELDLYKHAITRTCDRMSSMGYISRTVNPADNRMRLIEIKPKGRDLLMAFHAGVAQPMGKKALSRAA